MHFAVARSRGGGGDRCSKPATRLTGGREEAAATLEWEEASEPREKAWRVGRQGAVAGSSRQKASCRRACSHTRQEWCYGQEGSWG
jgi:hypothetical protein